MKMCARCGTQPSQLGGYCLSCRRDYARNRIRRRRLFVLVRYGGDPPACLCCGEMTYEFLGIDHLQGSGLKHRKEIAQLTRRFPGGSHLYDWLIKQGLPDGYRVLCHNCNLAQGFYGACPHMLANPSLLKVPPEK